MFTLTRWSTSTPCPSQLGAVPLKMALALLNPDLIALQRDVPLDSVLVMHFDIQHIELLMLTFVCAISIHVNMC
jgi:hypothetical protein